MSRMLLNSVPPFLLLFLAGQSIPIDNGVDGEPEVECGSTTITVNFYTRETFKGHVFVKPHFITKIDRAYRISCFYMEANEAVTSQLNVVELTTVNITEIVQMPVCKYEILEGGPHGKQLRYGKIGQQIYHQWSCSTENISIFCMLVHSCSVDDGRGDRVNILDSKGCAIDRHVLNNIEYPDNLLAGQETHVYKYADRDSLFYHCQISLQIIENGKCQRPRCSDLSFDSEATTNSKNKQEVRQRDSQNHIFTSSSKTISYQERLLTTHRGPRIHYPKTVKSVIDFRQQGDRLTTINPRLIRKRRDIHENPSDYMTVDVRAEMKALDIIDTEFEEPISSICVSRLVLSIVICFIMIEYALLFSLIVVFAMRFNRK